jgi:pectinesterase
VPLQPHSLVSVARRIAFRTFALVVCLSVPASSAAVAAADASPATKPLPRVKIVLIGDSTVNDSQGWGPGFKARLRPEAACANWAQNGRSSKSFEAEGWWKKALAEKPDYVLIQFGHNDQPGKGPARETDPATTYPAQLGKYVDEARAAGARPVIVTSLTRRLFADGKVKSNLTEYAEAAKKLAAEKKVPVVDLHALSIELLDKVGPEAAKAFDPPPDAPGAKPGQTDRTHLSAKGQTAFGGLMADAVKQAVPELAAYVR